MKQMRQIMMTVALMLTAGAMAQSVDETQPKDGMPEMAMRPQRMKRITQEQMTRRMVRELMLDEKQTKKVTKLNKKFKKLIEGEQQDNMKSQRPPMGQGRPGGNQGGGAPGTSPPIPTSPHSQAMYHVSSQTVTACM